MGFSGRRGLGAFCYSASSASSCCSAIGAHRAKRSRAISASPLDEIPGIGPARKRALLLHFGTAGKVRAAALEDLQRAPGVSEAVAQAVYDFYHPSG